MDQYQYAVQNALLQGPATIGELCRRDHSLQANSAAIGLARLATEDQVHADSFDGNWSLGPGPHPTFPEVEAVIMDALKGGPLSFPEILRNKRNLLETKAVYCLGILERRGTIRWDSSQHVWVLLHH